MPSRCGRRCTFRWTAGALGAALAATTSSRSARVSVSLVSQPRSRQGTSISCAGASSLASRRAARITRAAVGEPEGATQANPSTGRIDVPLLGIACGYLAAFVVSTSVSGFWLPWSTSTVVVEASATSNGRTLEAQKIVRATRETRTGAPLQDLTNVVDAMETNGDKAFVIGRLLDELTAAETVDRAMPVAKLVWQAWMFHENPIVAKLMKDGTACMAVGELQQAEWRFVNAIHFDPSYAEAWNKLATVHYLSNDLEASLYEIQETLELEPLHFGALSGKGLVLLKMDCFAEAAEAMRQAQEALDREFGSADAPDAAM
mmetsp:Transcript_50176/g.112966  ORF Transcript_50176/g.112966 Transcript_50176/m.112966 type:complete len:318 (+) Transcript_50176:34-987(+)